MVHMGDAPDWRMFSELLNARMLRGQDDIAFHDSKRTYTVMEFRELCLKAVAWLEGENIGKGDRVAVWLVNRIEWLALLFAVAHVGAIVVSVNTRYRSEEVSHILSRSGAKLLVLQLNFKNIDFPAIAASIDPSTLPALKKVAVVDADSTMPLKLIGRPTVAFRLGEFADSSPRIDCDASVILFTTSGTTKGPKLVAHPQRTIIDHAYKCVEAYKLGDPGACLLAVMPLCGVFGLNAVMAAFAAGAPVVMLETFEAQRAADLIGRHGVTHIFGGDEVFKRLIDASSDERPFPSARIFGFGAFTSSFTEYAIRATERGIPFHGLYGSSEVLALFSMQPSSLALAERLQGGGRPVAADAIVRIRNTETGQLADIGERGEIEIRAPSNFNGYFGDDAATSDAVLTDGFFRTGDVGYLRDDGSFVYETRMGDAVRLGGFLVNPAEIEQVMKGIDGVEDAQVVAIEIDGQPRAVAFVIVTAGRQLQETDLIGAMRSRVAAFKVPARVWFVESYPTTEGANGAKTQRGKLRELAERWLSFAGADG